MPLNRLPQGVSSTLDAGLLGGLSSSTWASSIRAGYSIHGGGTVSVSATGAVSWSQRFIVISVGTGSFFSTSGYYDINLPPVGTAIPGFGGSAGTTVTSEGISVPAWQVLYYELPLGSSSGSIASNFRLVSYFSAFDIPAHWIPICRVNGDSNVYHFPNGMNLLAGTSGTSGVTGTGAVVRANSPTFTGTPVFGAASSTNASFNIPHGSAPSTPTNGDIWTTTAGLYMRINGSTIGPVGSSYLSKTTPGATPYTLVLTDDAKSIEMGFAGANTLTIPLNSSVPFPIGTQILVFQTGAGQTTLSATGGVTLNGTPGLKLRAQWSSATLIKRNTDTWLAIGDLAA